MRKLILFISLLSFVMSFTFDEKYPKDDNKFWASHYDVPYNMAILVTSIALIEGDSSRIGKTAIKSLDSILVSSVVTQAVKYATGRVRPRSTESSNDWFNYETRNLSFPSGHVSSVTAFVTPFILEYRKDEPLIYLLALLPIHQMVGRVKAQAHWTSDVIAGLAVGALSGYFTYYNDSILLSFTNDKKFIGFRHRF